MKVICRIQRLPVKKKKCNENVRILSLFANGAAPLQVGLSCCFLYEKRGIVALNSKIS